MAEPEEKEEVELAETCTVDGKTVRASGDPDRGVPCMHIVSVWLISGLVVGQTAVPDKSNELTAIRQLLAKLELEGRVVSIDALGCRTDIAETVAEGGGGYLLAVKDNQSDLHGHRQRDFAYLDHTGGAAAPYGPCATASPTCPWTLEPHRWPIWCAVTGACPPGAGIAYTGCRTIPCRRTAAVCAQAMLRATLRPAETQRLGGGVGVVDVECCQA